MLEGLLAAAGAYAGPRTESDVGHQAEFVSYRDKTMDTVLGLVAIRRAWYHCAACGYGFAPRDARLGVAGQTTSLGLRKMIARAAAARLISELAGITLTGKRAKADGAAAAPMIEAQAAAIAACTLVPLPPTRPLPDMPYVCIDGTSVPIIAAETEGRDGKAAPAR